jgi:glycogen(starch) synthase
VIGLGRGGGGRWRRERAARIALVGDWPPPYGGVSVHVEGLARALRERGVDVRVLDTGRGDHRGAGLVGARGAIRYAVRLAGAVAERRLVHAHTSGASAKSWMVALAASRARLPGAPKPVLTVHSGLCPAWLGGGARRRRVARAACAGFGRIVAVSREIAGALERCGVRAERLSVIPAFLGEPLAPGAPPPRLAAVRAACAPLFCAAVGPGPHYGEDLLVAAFRAVRARAPLAGLVVFGRGSERGPGAAVGAPEGVVALGEIDHRDALAVIASCDVFVRPTRADGDALSVREALALGRTVVASDAGHRPPGCLVFGAGDGEALARQMLVAARLTSSTRGDDSALPSAGALERLLDLYRALAPRSIPGAAAGAVREAPCRP